jgi:uncharacterized membrane protein (DUF2068 family)
LSEFTYPESFKGRFFGLFILAILQFLNGTVHTTIGIFLIFTASGELVYNIYTLLYGILNLILGYGLWSGKKLGYLGTISVSLFIIVVDISTVLGVSLIAGVPKAAAFGEIMYSLFVISYLFQPKVIRLFMKIN